jgi:glycosyltransferase involved in cell wall biosynthesis
MEAIGSGCPPLVGAVAGLDDLLGEFAQHACIQPGDTAQVAARILDVLKDAQGARMRVLALRERLIGKIDWMHIAQGYAEVLRNARTINAADARRPDPEEQG